MLSARQSAARGALQGVHDAVVNYKMQSVYCIYLQSV